MLRDKSIPLSSICGVASVAERMWLNGILNCWMCGDPIGANGRRSAAPSGQRTRQRVSRLNVPSALLIDYDTRSAGEIMAYGYQRGAFGLLVGTPTAGAVSAGATFVMPGDLLLYVAVAGIDFDGRRLEGGGVIPDRRVERLLPYAAGFDPVLDTAVDLLTKDTAK